MRISKNKLKLLIENFLHEETSIGDFQFDEEDFFTVTSQVSDYGGVDEDIKQFLRLVGFVCAFEIFGEEYIENASQTGAKYIQVTSGRRSGMAQLNAWLDKIAAGESRDETIALYTPGDDPFMTSSTQRITTLAYDRLVKKIKEKGVENNPASLKNSSELADIAKMLNDFPVSAHLGGQSIDLRAIGGRKPYVIKTLEYIKDNKLAEFYYKYEPKPPHIHLGPAYAEQDEWLTEAGYKKISEYEQLVFDKISDQEPIPYEHMP